MKIRAIVEQLTDGVTVNLPAEPVPVTVDFDPNQVIGRASIVRDGNNLIADMDVNIDPGGLFPSIGFRVQNVEPHLDGVRELRDIEVLCVGLHRSPNVDPSIPPIKQG